MAKVWLDKASQKRIIIQSGKGLKKILEEIPDKGKIPHFLGGECKNALFDNPGAISKEIRTCLEKGLVSNPNHEDLKKYFWDVDMSVKGNEFGVQSVEKNDDQKYFFRFFLLIFRTDSQSLKKKEMFRYGPHMDEDFGVSSSRNVGKKGDKRNQFMTQEGS